MLSKKISKCLSIIALTGLFSVMGFPCFSQNDGTADFPAKEKISVDKTVHDFGTLSTGGDEVKASFVVTNNTDLPIVLTQVKASCGCTKPSWTKKPIAPGQTGEVTAVYNPKGHKGAFEKVLTISISEDIPDVEVKIKGTVE